MVGRPAYSMANTFNIVSRMRLNKRTPSRRIQATRRFALLIFLCALGGPVLSKPGGIISEPFFARYSLTTQGAKIGVTEWTMKAIAADIFVYESRTVAAGIYGLVSDQEVTERSEWQLRDGMIQPLSYSYHRSGGDRERDVAVNFDWETRQAENTAEGHSWRMPVPDGTLDKLSYLLVMMRDLAEAKSPLRYQIADGGRLKVYELRIEGEERIDTALGSLDTVVVRRLRDSDERETLLWCAESLDYMPVKIEHREKDGTVLWRIESYERQ